MIRHEIFIVEQIDGTLGASVRKIEHDGTRDLYEIGNEPLMGIEVLPDDVQGKVNQFLPGLIAAAVSHSKLSAFDALKDAYGELKQELITVLEQDSEETDA